MGDIAAAAAACAAPEREPREERDLFDVETKVNSEPGAAFARESAASPSTIAEALIEHATAATSKTDDDASDADYGSARDDKPTRRQPALELLALHDASTLGGNAADDLVVPIAFDAVGDAPPVEATTGSAPDETATAALASAPEHDAATRAAVSTARPAEATAPSAEATAPSAEATTPPAEATAPSAEATAPSAEATTPSAEASTPAANAAPEDAASSVADTTAASDADTAPDNGVTTAPAANAASNDDTAADDGVTTAPAVNAASHDDTATGDGATAVPAANAASQGDTATGDGATAAPAATASAPAADATAPSATVTAPTADATVPAAEATATNNDAASRDRVSTAIDAVPKEIDDAHTQQASGAPTTRTPALEPEVPHDQVARRRGLPPIARSHAHDATVPRTWLVASGAFSLACLAVTAYVVVWARGEVREARAARTAAAEVVASNSAAPIAPSAPAVAPSPTTVAMPAAAPAPATCSMRLSTNVDGAAVYIDGIPRGTAPAEVPVACGIDTLVELRHPRYEDFKRSLSVTGGTLEVDARLEREKTELTVWSDPPGAHVTYNGHAIGKTPLVTKVNRYERGTLLFRAPGRAADWRKIVPKGPTKTVSITLKPRT